MNKETVKKETTILSQNNPIKWISDWNNDKITNNEVISKLYKCIKKDGWLGMWVKMYEEELIDGRTVINLDRCKSRTHQIKLLLADGFKTTFIDNITDKQVKEDADVIMYKLLRSISTKRLNKLYKMYCSNVVEPENYDDKKAEEFWNYTMSEYKDICLIK